MQILGLVIYLIVGIFAFLIFPFFIGFHIDANYQKKKIFYRIDVFSFIKVLNGYVQAKKDGIFIHLTKRRAIMVPYENIVSIRNKVKPLRDYHVINFNSRLYLGQLDGVLGLTTIAFIYNFVVNNVEWFLYHYKPYFKTRNQVFVLENTNVFNLCINATVVFNFLMVLISLIKILVEKIVYAITRKTQ